MGANRFIKYIMKKHNSTKTVGKKVELGELEPGDYFIFPTLYNGLIGELVACDMNATVKWLNHPDKIKNKKEIISASAEVYKYEL